MLLEQGHCFGRRMAPKISGFQPDLRAPCRQHQGTSGRICRHLWLPPSREGTLLASNGWWAGLVLHSPQDTGQPHQTTIQPQISPVTGLDELESMC